MSMLIKLALALNQKKNIKVFNMVTVEDRSSIKSIKSKYPEITSKDAEQNLLKMYNEIRDKEDYLSKIRMEAITLDSKLKDMKGTFNKLKDLFEIEFESKDVAEINNNMHLGIVTTDIKRIH